MTVNKKQLAVDLKKKLAIDICDAIKRYMVLAEVVDIPQDWQLCSIGEVTLDLASRSAHCAGFDRATYLEIAGDDYDETVASFAAHKQRRGS